MFKTLLNKVKVWLDSKAEEAYPLNPEPSDPDENTMREVEAPKDKVTSWFKLTFKF
jgi:hypothetical protein